MSDLIERQNAIDALLHNQKVYSNNFGTDAIDKYTIAIIDNDVQTIAQLTSAEPERKKGHWELTDFPDEQTYKCSACGEVWTFIEGSPFENGAYFCPNCGADMRGGQE